jgi:endonuclease/exonuclease/phosphatase family metal-dependent hydrolase
VGKHASQASSFPRQALLGILLALALVGLVTARATGVVGGEDADRAASPATPSPSTSASELPTQAPSESPSAEASPEPRSTEESEGRAKPVGEKSGSDRSDGSDGSSQRTDESQKDLASAVEESLAEQIVPTAFRVMSFNVLGHSHTVGGGNKRGYASGPARIGMAMQILRSFEVDVVGLQEFEPIQNYSFLRRGGGQWDTYPGMQLGRKGVRNSVAWRTDVWDVVTTRTFASPYFRGNRVPMPYVQLEHRETGQRVWFINIHNPTSNAKRGQNERFRDIGTTLQVNLANRLEAATGDPVILMGDFNERAEAFCRVTRTGMSASAGGSVGGACRPPGDLGIDWIFGTRDLSFESHVRTRGGLISRATDHPVVVADAVVTPDES